MKHKIATSVITCMIVGLCFYCSSSLVSTAYALQHSIDAYHTIRWLQIHKSESIGTEIRESQIWLACDDQGQINRLRFHADKAIDVVGPLTIAGDIDYSEAWMPRLNLHLTGYGNPNALLKIDISQLNPKTLLEELFQQEQTGEAIVDIHQPSTKTDPIQITVTYPQGTRSENWKKVFFIDQASNLISKTETWERHDQDFHCFRTLEFTDYNQPIDPAMFTLDGDVPAQAWVVDMTDHKGGMLQGQLTREELATRITTEFFEAVIAEDFEKAGQLFIGVPDFLVKQAFQGARALQILEIGSPHVETDPDSDAMICSCKVLLEWEGVPYELDVSMLRIKNVDPSVNRWVICGAATGLQPATGTITLTPDNIDLAAVTYDGLTPGKFMQKWLMLDPITIAVRGNTYFPTEDTQKADFDRDLINVTQFPSKVNINEKERYWSLLECNYGTIDLAQVDENWYQYTYAWAQIDMDQETPVVLGIGSDDAVKVWLNGTLVHSHWTTRGVVLDEDRIEITLNKGQNQLVLKIQNRGGPWGFCCRRINP